MPQEIAATLSRNTLAFSMLRLFIQEMQSASATHAPVIDAVRVPPSAWITSQSTVICRSPSASRSTAARKERPIRRWISTVRPPCLPAAASRRVRSRVARGSMPYSAVTQPLPWPLSQGGSRSSSVAVTSTWVSPNLTIQEPSAYLTTPRSSDTARSSSGARRLGRMGNPPESLKKRLARGACRRGKRQRQGPWVTPDCTSTVPWLFLYCSVAVHFGHAFAQSLLVTGRRDRQIRGCCKEYLVAHHEPIGLIAPNTGLAQLNERSRDIFRQIVESYLATGEPVGSRNISRLIAVPLSPASVRNVMSDLEQLGLIYAPHTSAGRLPTELGLRFFVDALMQIGDLTEEDRRSIEAQVAASGQGRSLEAVLTEASVLLSGLTHAAGVVLTAKSNIRLKHIEFVRLEPGRALVVLVAEDGQVENRILSLPPGLPSSALTEATNFLNARIRNRTLAEAKAELERGLEAGKAELDQLTQKIVAAGLASWSGGESEERKLIVRGHANLLEDLKALADLERVRLLFDDLETKRDVIDLLGRAEQADGVRLFIGSENKLFSLSGSSTIIAPYRDGAGRIVGVIGVIGPTRLNYARIIPMVDYTAKVVSKVLSG